MYTHIYVYVCTHMYSFFKYGVKQSFSFLCSSLPPFPLPKLCVKFIVHLPKETHYFLSA